MCVDPVTATMVAASATKAVSSVFGGITARNAANANAALADQNAEHANRQAGDAILRGSDETARRYLALGQTMGRQAAATAANGIELGFGSPLEAVGGTAAMGEMDAETLRENARREAEGFRMSAINARQSAASSRAQGQAAFVSGLIDGFGTLLGAARQILGGPKGPNVKLTRDTLTVPPGFSTALPPMPRRI